MASKIEVREVPYGENLCCPFCESVVADWDKVNASGGEEGYSTCPHTILVGHDMGIDFVDDRFTDAFGLQKAIFEGEYEDVVSSLDELTSLCPIPGSVKLAQYQPAPSFYGNYACFAPK